MWYEIGSHKPPAEYVSVGFRADSGKDRKTANYRMVLSMSGALVTRLGFSKRSMVQVLFSPEQSKLMLRPASGEGKRYSLTGTKATLQAVLAIDGKGLTAEPAERVPFTVEGQTLVADYPSWMRKVPTFTKPPEGAVAVAVGARPGPLTEQERAEMVGRPAPRQAAPDEPPQHLEAEPAPSEPAPPEVLQVLPGDMQDGKANPVLDRFCSRVARRAADILSPPGERAPITEPLMPHLRQAEVKESPVLVDLARKPYLLQGASLSAMAHGHVAEGPLQAVVVPQGTAPHVPGAVKAEPIEVRILQVFEDGTSIELQRVQPIAEGASFAEADSAIEALRQDMLAKVPDGFTVKRQGHSLLVGSVRGVHLARPESVASALDGVKAALAKAAAAGRSLAEVPVFDPPLVVAAEVPSQGAELVAADLNELGVHPELVEVLAAVEVLPVPAAVEAHAPIGLSAREQAAEDRARRARVEKALWVEAEDRLCKGEGVAIIADETGLPASALSKLAGDLRKAGRR